MAKGEEREREGNFLSLSARNDNDPLLSSSPSFFAALIAEGKRQSGLGIPGSNIL